jgi:hypothetical protein
MSTHVIWDFGRPNRSFCGTKYGFLPFDAEKTFDQRIILEFDFDDADGTTILDQVIKKLLLAEQV